MRLSLIGMSGSGKSSWSIKLSELGFKRFCCDDMITEKLDRDLTRPDGTCMKLGEWMGFPYEPHYEEVMRINLNNILLLILPEAPSILEKRF